MKSIAATLLCLLTAAAPAQEPSAATRKEIAHLFQALGQSGCQFQRNGSWHNANKAAAHLQKKYTYLLAKELVPTTETFIDRAASKSSLSGKSYRVRCPGAADVDSRAWFTAEVARWRRLKG